jgi:hypothetical protein
MIPPVPLCPGVPWGLPWERHRRGTHISNKAASCCSYTSLDVFARVYLAGAEGLAGVVCVL